VQRKSRSDVIRNGFFIGETPDWLTAGRLIFSKCHKID
jgi:hypothetical protein